MIHQRPAEERPRERCLRVGPRALSLRECLALLIGAGPRGKGCLGLAEDLMRELGGTDDSFYEWIQSSCGTDDSLIRLRGLGDATRCRLLALAELSRRYRDYAVRRPQAQSFSQDIDLVVGCIPEHLWNWPREWLGVVLFSSQSEDPIFQRVADGAEVTVAIHVGSLFRTILLHRTHGFFLVHNHPNGDPKPSQEDYEMTKVVHDIARSLDITLWGHLIVGPHGVSQVT